MTTADSRWNLNIHYHRAVLEAIPAGARTALDVGSGDGILAFDLADRGLSVLGLDPDPASVERARADPRASGDVRFVVGDLFGDADGSFDVVASIAMLHHVDAESGLRRMRELVAPGGTLAIVGFARPSTPADAALAAVGSLRKRSRQLRHRYWEHSAPTVWPPPMTMRDMGALVRRELPGAGFRRALSNRYVVTWRRPAG